MARRIAEAAAAGIRDLTLGVVAVLRVTIAFTICYYALAAALLILACGILGEIEAISTLAAQRPAPYTPGLVLNAIYILLAAVAAGYPAVVIIRIGRQALSRRRRPARPAPRHRPLPPAPRCPPKWAKRTPHKAGIPTGKRGL